MADEALRELVTWLRAEAVDEQSWGVEPYRIDRVNAANARADALESALSELVRLRGEREWKPIETAPKDRWILVWCHWLTGSEAFTRAHWVDYRKQWRRELQSGECDLPPAVMLLWRDEIETPSPVQSHEEKQG